MCESFEESDWVSVASLGLRLAVGPERYAEV